MKPIQKKAREGEIKEECEKIILPKGEEKKRKGKRQQEEGKKKKGIRIKCRKKLCKEFR